MFLLSTKHSVSCIVTTCVVSTEYSIHMQKLIPGLFTSGFKVIPITWFLWIRLAVAIQSHHSNRYFFNGYKNIWHKTRSDHPRYLDCCFANWYEPWKLQHLPYFGSCLLSVQMETIFSVTLKRRSSLISMISEWFGEAGGVTRQPVYGQR